MGMPGGPFGIFDDMVRLRMVRAARTPLVADDLDHLRMAERHLVEAESRIERQAELVDRLEAAGHPTELARALLSSFVATLAQMQAHRDYLEIEAEKLGR